MATEKKNNCNPHRPKEQTRNGPITTQFNYMIITLNLSKLREQFVAKRVKIGEQKDKERCDQPNKSSATVCVYGNFCALSFYIGLDEIISLLNDFHQRICRLENAKYDMEFEVKKKDFEVHT